MSKDEMDLLQKLRRRGSRVTVGGGMGTRAAVIRKDKPIFYGSLRALYNLAQGGYVKKTYQPKFYIPPTGDDAPRLTWYAITDKGRQRIGAKTRASVRLDHYTPLQALSWMNPRKKQETPSPEMIKAGHRLSVDFEMALESKDCPFYPWLSKKPDDDKSTSTVIPVEWFYGPAPTDTIGKVMHHLGPGLSEAMLLCICQEVSVRDAEERLNWRSGGRSIAMMALHRLTLYYRDVPDLVG